MLRTICLASCAVLMLALLNQACTHEPFDPPTVTPGPADTSGGDGNDTIVNPGDTTATGNSDCSPDTIYFNRDLMPIFSQSCAFGGCHDAVTASDGVVLDNYLNVFNTADVDPGEPLKSKLYQVLVDTDVSDRMPQSPRPPLSDAKIAMVRLWIEQGALNLTCVDSVANDTTTNDTTVNDTCITANMSYSSDIVPILSSNGCIGCHSGGSVILSNYSGMKATVDNGTLSGAINHEAGFNPMPQNQPKLDSCTLAQIGAWIAAGAPNN